jgi:outer membrane murein-binding lipoprotein Lpp
VITPVVIIGTVVVSVVGGAASAAGGWLFHKFFKLNAQVNELHARVSKLEAR